MDFRFFSHFLYQKTLKHFEKTIEKTLEQKTFKCQTTKNY